MYRRIRELREDNDYKQKELADFLGCSQVCYSHYENGKREPSLDMLNKLSKYFNVSIDYLINGEEFKKK